MRLAFSRRRGWRPRHARPSWIARTPLSPRWLVASLVVFSLTGVAAQLSPHPEESAAQHTAAAAPASVTSYFAPRRTTPPPASRIPAARPLTHAVDVRAAALPSVPEPSPVPAASPGGGSEEGGRSDVAGQSGPDRWSPRFDEPHPSPSSPGAQERCGDSFIALWSDCGGKDGS